MTKTRRNTRADGDQTAARILEVAGRLFAAQGFAHTPSKAIAAEAEVDLASINYHYGSRDGLYQAALADSHRRLVDLETLRRIDESGVDPAGKVTALIDVLLDAAFTEKNSFVRLLARELLAPTATLDAVITEEVMPKAAVVLKMLSQYTGIAPEDPALLRCLISVGAPCLVLVMVQSHGLPGRARDLLATSRADLAAHLHKFALAGLKAVGARPDG